MTREHSRPGQLGRGTFPGRNPGVLEVVRRSLLRCARRRLRVAWDHCARAPDKPDGRCFRKARAGGRNHTIVSVLAATLLPLPQP
jgi:hypothetical protein